MENDCDTAHGGRLSVAVLDVVDQPTYPVGSIDVAKVGCSCRCLLYFCDREIGVFILAS